MFVTTSAPIADYTTVPACVDLEAVSGASGSVAAEPAAGTGVRTGTGTPGLVAPVTAVVTLADISDGDLVQAAEDLPEPDMTEQDLIAIAVLAKARVPRARNASHLGWAQIGLQALPTDPDVLGVDCDALSAAAGADLGLPSGTIGVARLQAWLLANPRNYVASDAVWRELVIRARRQGGHWRLAAAGIATPGMRHFARQWYPVYRGDPADLDAEMLVAFLEALDHRADVSGPRVFTRLLWAARRAAIQLCQGQEKAELAEDIEHVAAGPRVPRLPYGHVDVLVWRAASAGVIPFEDVEPFLDVRVAGKSLLLTAARMGITAGCLRMRLERAAQRLGEALAAGRMTETPVPEAVRCRAGAAGGGRAPVTGLAQMRPLRAHRRATTPTAQAA